MADREIDRILTTAAMAVFAAVTPVASATLIDLATEPADVSVLGEAGVDYLGSWLATGDINGDGIEDLLAVACNSHPLGGTRTGTLYILWGGQLGQQSIVDLPLSPPGVSRIFGNPGDDDLYCTVTCGDFNHDGCDDIVWGSPAAGAQYTWSGKAYVIFGSHVFPDTLDLHMQPPGVVTVYGDATYAFLGAGSCACDVDGDDYEDIVVSAKYLEYAEVYVIRGRDVFPATFHTQVPEPDMTRIIDNEPNRGTGAAIACRDVNGDGCGDLLLGAPGNGPPTMDGRVLLVYGSLSMPDTVLLGNPSVPVKRILPEYEHGALGASVAIADLNADARQDLVVGAWGADPMGCYDCGEVYILYDADSLPDTVSLASTSVPMTRVMGSGSSTRNGYRVLCSDLSGDPIDDLALTNWPLNQRATTSVIFGRQLMPTTIFLATESGPITRIKENKKGDRLGNGVAAIDLDSDGVKDLMLGASHAAPGRYAAGIVYGFLSSHLATPVGPTRGHPLSLKNFPNPFSSQTTVTFGALQGGAGELSIFDVGGRRVFARTIANHRSGDLEVVWDGRDEQGKMLPSGVYFCRARIGGVTEMRKMVLVR